MNSDFFKKNFNHFHIAGVLIFVVLAVFYWYKSGQFSEYFFKNNLVLVIIWGVLVGWITADFVFHARHDKDDNQDKKW